jgi:hypothetical protein
VYSIGVVRICPFPSPMWATKESNDFTFMKSLADYHICEQFVTGVYHMSVHLIRGHLIGIHLIGVYLMSGCPIGVYIRGV